MDAVGTGCAQLMHVDGMFCSNSVILLLLIGPILERRSKILQKVDCSSSLTVHCRACVALVVMKRRACDLCDGLGQLCLCCRMLGLHVCAAREVCKCPLSQLRWM